MVGVTAPMLARTADPDKIEQYLSNSDWFMSQKLDGQRLIVQVLNGKVTGFGRKLNEYKLPDDLTLPLNELHGTWLFDGEYLNDTYYIFDVLTVLSTDVAAEPYAARREWLNKIMARFATANPDAPIQSVFSTNCAPEKRSLFEKCLTENREGVIFRRADAPYESKRSVNLLKWKFISTAECVVMGFGKDGKQNFSVGLYDGDDLTEVADVSRLNGDGPRVQLGDVVQIEFLYVTENRRLFHPTNPKLRTDKETKECKISQLDNLYTRKDII